MKNKGLISFILIISFFILLDFLIINDFKNKEEESNRIFLISNVENLQAVKKSKLDINGDYLVNFNLDENLYDAIAIKGDYLLIDNNEYAEAKFYKEKDYNKYVNVIENNFDVKIDEYFNVLKDDIITNVSEEGKIIYNTSFKNINDMLLALEGNIKLYTPKDNKKWLRVLNTFNIDTNKIFNKKILKESSIKIKEDLDYKEKFYLSFINLNDYKEKEIDKSNLKYIG